MNRLVSYLVFFISAIYIDCYSQEESFIEKVRFGIDIGLDFPNKKYAQFLDGSHPFGVNSVLTNSDTKFQIENKYGYSIKNWEYSLLNKYQNSLYSGLFFGFDLNQSFSIVLKLNFSVVKYISPLIIEFDNPNKFFGEFVQANITAREKRFGCGLGIEKRKEIIPKLNIYGSIGAVLNSIQLESHILDIEGLTYNIMRVQQVQSTLSKNVKGIGYGAYLEGGVTYYLNEKFTLAFGLNFNFQNNKKYVSELTDNTNYISSKVEKAKKILLDPSFYFRIIWN